MDIATRVWNHTFKLDPIFRSALDQDFYKLLMAQLIWRKHKNTKATFRVINRTKDVNLFQSLSLPELRAQLDHARDVRFTRQEITWLRGNSFYGKRQMFESDFLDWLENFQLPEYNLEVHSGEVELSFAGNWLETTFWEIPALSIINELRSRTVFAEKLNDKLMIDIAYANAKSKLWGKLQRIKELTDDYDFTISDFGSRRRHSFLWQRYCVQALVSELPKNFIGTSNALLAMENNLEAIGTNAHELPMVYAALTNSDQELKDSRYHVLDDWQDAYNGNLLVMLPDAFGSESFFRDLPSRFEHWVGTRPDSLPWYEACQDAIDFWNSVGQDPSKKLVVLSDGMDIDSIVNAIEEFSSSIRIGIGWGTNLTNDFVTCDPRGYFHKDLNPISVVCKVVSANDRPAVKLSDNPTKATGDRLEIDRYLKVFGSEGRIEREVVV